MLAYQFTAQLRLYTRCEDGIRSGMRLSLLALALPLALGAQTQQSSPDVDRSARVDSLLAAVVPKDGPGAAVMVISNGRVVHQKGYGFADLETRRPIDARTTFDLASVSKQFTTMAIMMLAERGKLAYDDPVTKFFPELPEYAKRITLRHLMTHTSGMPDYMSEFRSNQGKYSSEPTSREVIAMLAQLPKPDFAVGAKYEYSNSGYVVLGQVAEKVAGVPLPQFMKTEIFDKLGMSSTILSDQVLAPSANRAISYRPRGGKYENADFSPLNRIYGDGNVNTSLEDMFKWDQALYGDALVKQSTLAQAFEPMTLNDGSKSDYGFGWRLMRWNDQRVYTHGGSWAGFRTSILRVPSERLTVVVLANAANMAPPDLAQKIGRLWVTQ
jgi:CubicO group peptidase (beta-lactamase class C family)